MGKDTVRGKQTSSSKLLCLVVARMQVCRCADELRVSTRDSSQQVAESAKSIRGEIGLVYYLLQRVQSQKAGQNEMCTDQARNMQRPSAAATSKPRPTQNVWQALVRSLHCCCELWRLNLSLVLALRPMSYYGGKGEGGSG